MTVTADPGQAAEPPRPGGAVVTGVGTSGGLQIAQALASRGHPVHLTDPDGALATRAAEALGPPAFASALDVRSPAACRAAAARTRRRVGSLEVWVNNAAALGTGAAWELDERTRQRMVEVNLVGTINGTLAALELMRADGVGSVVNVIPLPRFLATPGEAVYSASRQAAIAFSLGVLADLRRAGLAGIHVSCLCPPERRGKRPSNPSAETGGGGGAVRDRDLDRLIAQVLDGHPPLLATPHWRARLLRLYYLWPGPAAAARRALGGAVEGSGVRRRTRSRRWRSS